MGTKRIGFVIFLALFLCTLGINLVSAKSCPAFAVYGLIADKYAKLGGPDGALGCPTSDEQDDRRGGRYNSFDNGYIYWQRDANEAFAVQGLIAVKYNELGREVGYGYPETDELTTPDGLGRFNHFENGGSIYWTPNTGAHAVYGLIRQKWSELGWETSQLGYPVSDEQDFQSGRRVVFENGAIYFWPSSGGMTTSINRKGGNPATLIHDSGLITFSDSTPFQGRFTFVMNDLGQFTYSGHVNDSSDFGTITYGALAVATTPSGIAFTAQHTGSSTDTWTDTGVNPEIQRNWTQVSQSGIRWTLTTNYSLIPSILSDMLKQAAKDLGMEALKAVIKLL